MTHARTRTLAEWLAYLESIHPNAIDMGLDRVSQVAQRLAIDFAGKVITVAGTNGKGTTCRMLESILLAQGKRVGVYSSPHINDYRERVRINGTYPDSAAFCDAFAEVEQARQSISLTYFEFGTLAALLMLQKENPDYVLLEVGLGGRLDATNVIDPSLAVITTIDLDHQDWLGDTREKIAVEKAGIFRPSAPAIIGELSPPSTLNADVVSKRINAKWAQHDFGVRENNDGTWDWFCDDFVLSNLPEPAIIRQNVSTALACLWQLGELEDSSTLRQCIAETQLIGRRQMIVQQPQVVVDVAHNPQSVDALATWINRQHYQRLFLVVGMLKDKAIKESLSPLLTLNANWVVAPTTGPRGLPGEALEHALREMSVEQVKTCDSVVQAYHYAYSQAGVNDLIVVFGSFLTVADILANYTSKH